MRTAATMIYSVVGALPDSDRGRLGDGTKHKVRLVHSCRLYDAISDEERQKEIHFLMLCRLEHSRDSTRASAKCENGCDHMIPIHVTKELLDQSLIKLQVKAQL